MWWKKFFRSFRYAGAGVVHTIKTQRNMRVHLVAACYIFWVSHLARLTGAELALITLCCGLVMALELGNTALEALCDRVTTQWDKAIEIAKDAGAGAVLIAAIASVGVACWLLGDWVLSGGLLEHPAALAAMGVCLIPAFFFVRWDGK